MVFGCSDLVVSVLELGYCGHSDWDLDLTMNFHLFDCGSYQDGCLEGYWAGRIGAGSEQADSAQEQHRLMVHFHTEATSVCPFDPF